MAENWASALPKVPKSFEELQTLPLWARVAFAARCAQRVQPLLRRAWPDASREHVEAVDNAVLLVLAAAKDPARASATELRAAAKAARTAREAAYTASSAARYDAVTNPAVNAARAALGAAWAAIAAMDVKAATPSDATKAADAVTVNAVFAGAFAVDFARAADAAETVHAMRRDFDELARLAREERWTEDTPVDAARLGPLYPVGEPKSDRGRNPDFPA